ncbi:hypothetical protein KGQ71_04780 [Patescibacteria group bacterium]|nr:hypothetical protein [Patescibacteria group bacterium]
MHPLPLSRFFSYYGVVHAHTYSPQNLEPGVSRFPLPPSPFLPFSSWFISLSGLVNISLIRDVLILCLAAAVLFSHPQPSRNPAIIWAILFCVWAALSYLWRTDSPTQWLRGLRFDIMPVFFFALVSQLRLPEPGHTAIRRVIYAGFIVIAVISALQLADVNIPLATGYSGVGALAAVHKVRYSGIGALLTRFSPAGQLLYCRTVCELSDRPGRRLFLLAIYGDQLPGEQRQQQIDEQVHICRVSYILKA